MNKAKSIAGALVMVLMGLGLITLSVIILRGIQ